MNQNKIKIGITIGDINGIGPELIIKTFLDEKMLQLCTPIIYGSSRILSYHRKALNLDDFKYHMLKQDSNPRSDEINVINCWEEEIKLNLGESSKIAGQYSYMAIENAVSDLVSNKISALVTAPIDKYTIANESNKFIGHTEYLQEKFEVSDSLMMMVAEDFKVAVVSGHIPLKDVASSITTEMIYNKIKIFNTSLREDFNIEKPKLAVLGLNPHAGDQGLLGHEEQEIILPAIEKANKDNIIAFGPYSADGFFGAGSYKNFDGILSMYHDQGLVGFKTISFDTGVNYTAGLPGIRTSPDHGPAFDLAGKNIASLQSFRNAIYMAIDISRNRINYKEMFKNPLQPREIEKDNPKSSRADKEIS